MPHAIYLQDTQAPGPIQGVVSFVQVQEDCMEDRLPQGRNLPKQLDLKGGGRRTATYPESVEEVVVGDGNHRHRLPNHLHKDYAVIVLSPFQDQDHRLPGRLL